MTAAAPSMLFNAPAQAAPSHVVADAAALDARLQTAPPAEIIAAAIKHVGRDKLAVVSSFGTESAALLGSSSGRAAS